MIRGDGKERSAGKQSTERCKETRKKKNITEACFLFSWLSGTIIAKAGIRNKEKAVAMASDRKSNTLADGKMLFVTHRWEWARLNAQPAR